MELILHAWASFSPVSNVFNLVSRQHATIQYQPHTLAFDVNRPGHSILLHTSQKVIRRKSARGTLISKGSFTFLSRVAQGWPYRQGGGNDALGDNEE